MIQLMPEATDAAAEQLEKQVREIGSVTDMIVRGMSAQDILFKVTDGFDMLVQNKTVEPKYECKCSKERMERALISIGSDELSKLIEEKGEAELCCQFCDRRYLFDKNELENLLLQAKG